MRIVRCFFSPSAISAPQAGHPSQLALRFAGMALVLAPSPSNSSNLSRTPLKREVREKQRPFCQGSLSKDTFTDLSCDPYQHTAKEEQKHTGQDNLSLSLYHFCTTTARLARPNTTMALLRVLQEFHPEHLARSWYYRFLCVI